MRMRIVFGIIFSVWVLLLVRVYYLSVRSNDFYEEIAEQNAVKTQYLAPVRGLIMDVKGRPMAVNRLGFSVAIRPHLNGKRAEILDAELENLQNLFEDLNITKLKREYVKTDSPYNQDFIQIIDFMDYDKMIPRIAELSLRENLEIKPASKRHYPYNSLASHIIGYVGDITQEEINVLYNQGYTRNSVVGKTGIERQYDQLLQGTSGLESRTVDVRGRILSDKADVRPPQPGKNLVLTIDSRIQTLAEKTLGNRVGAVVVLKPATGEILALVSYPYFDPNIFNSDDYAQEYVKLRDSPEKPLLNRAVAAQYPPGSTFKIIMVTALLQEKTFSPFEKIECKGKLLYGNRIFHCHVHEPGHGWLDLKNALAQSCDVYFWTIGRDYLGIDKIAQYSTMFGLGKSAEIDLPTQASGFIPTAQWKERKYHERWLGGDTMSASIGQGYILATPLQVADMMAMVCTEGVVYKPHLLKEVRDPVTNEVITEGKPEVLFKSDIPADVWKTVQEDCRYTITDGTPQYPMRNKRFQSAGKTGTSEVAQYKNSWHSWMVAYAPYDAPVEDQIVVSTLVEAVNKWEWWAPYATNIIIQGTLANQTYEEAVNALGFHYLLANGNRQE